MKIKGQAASIVNLDKILYYIKRGALTSSPDDYITIKKLYDIGAIPKVEHGLKLLSRGINELNFPLFIEVSKISDEALNAIKKNNGQVR